MWHIGIDLHRKTIVASAVHDTGEIFPLARFECQDTALIEEWFRER